MLTYYLFSYIKPIFDITLWKILNNAKIKNIEVNKKQIQHKIITVVKSIKISTMIKCNNE